MERKDDYRWTDSEIPCVIVILLLIVTDVTKLMNIVSKLETHRYSSMYSSRIRKYPQNPYIMMGVHIWAYHWTKLLYFVCAISYNIFANDHPKFTMIMTKNVMIIVQNYHDHDAKLKSHATRISSSNTKTNLKYEFKFWFSTPSFLFLTSCCQCMIIFVHCYRDRRLMTSRVPNVNSK